MLPVPLNSSYTTSSILLPVLTSAVARIVRLPPSRMFLAAPKNLFGIWSAAGSRPPDKVRPLGGTVMLYALASLVILSSKIITSFPCSTSLFALSITISETLLWCSGSSSKVEYITSTLSPTIASLISVTSSGLSSINKIIISISGLFLRTAFAVSFNNVVLPAFGGETIIPRCPLPIGLTKSITLMAVLCPSVSRWSLSFGKIGVKSSKLGLDNTLSRPSPFILST